MKIKAILFDVDDTLFDREQAQKVALEMLVKRFPELLGGFDIPRLRDAWQESDRISTVEFETNAPSEIVRDARSREFVRLLGISQEYALPLSTAYYDEYPAIYAPMPGAPELVQKLSRIYKTGIISNSFVDVQHRKLDTLGIRHLFECIVLSEDIGIRKPDPRIFHHAARLLQVTPQACLYVGDSNKNDVAGSRSAGMQSCWFNPGQHMPPGLPAVPDFEVKTLAEIEEFLTQ
jgi:putative hydrolase of the HAD superfamily